MRLKLFITLGFVLFLSTLASSNECSRYSGKCAADSAKPVKPAPRPAVTADTESSTLVINKLLYI